MATLLSKCHLCDVVLTEHETGLVTPHDCTPPSILTKLLPGEIAEKQTDGTWKAYSVTEGEVSETVDGVTITSPNGEFVSKTDITTTVEAR